MGGFIDDGYVNVFFFSYFFGGVIDGLGVFTRGSLLDGGMCILPYYLPTLPFSFFFLNRKMNGCMYRENVKSSVSLVLVAKC